MKKYILFAFIVVVLFSCGSNKEEVKEDGKVVFTPKEKTETIVTKGPAAHKDPMDPVAFDGCVKLMIMLPEGLPGATEGHLRNKMLTMTSINNIGAIDGNPIFVLVPTITVINHDITSTIPAKHKLKFDFDLYVANLATGDIYGNLDEEIVGIGDSEELALSTAISGIDPSADKYQNMLKTAHERIISYYNTNGDRLIDEAKMLANTKKFEEALTILNSIPSVCSCYKKAFAAKSEIMKKYFVNNSEILLAQMKAALASPRDCDEGYSKEFVALYAMMPATCASRAEADKLFANYQKSLDDAAVKVMTQKEKEWARQIQKEDVQFLADREDKKYEFEKYKIEMESKVAIEGQTVLLEKYKKDASYNQMGFFRKLFYKEGN